MKKIFLFLVMVSIFTTLKSQTYYLESKNDGIWSEVSGKFILTENKFTVIEKNNEVCYEMMLIGDTKLIRGNINGCVFETRITPCSLLILNEVIAGEIKITTNNCSKYADVVIYLYDDEFISYVIYR